MVTPVKQTLNTDTEGAPSATLELTTETNVAIYVVAESGSHDSHRISLQMSPNNGDDWVEHPTSIVGLGYFVLTDVVATQVKACVIQAEGKASEVTVHILAL